MSTEEYVEILTINGILVEELGSINAYKITFESKYNAPITQNLNMYRRDINFFLTAAKNKAVMTNRVTNFIAPPSVTMISTMPYSFEFDAPLPIVCFFAERIVNII
ncbi:hypothetical protein ACFTQ7_12825 [Lysinibacillus sp. NPDC056959]|uniref:hypothetical protein n=1 Tax=Lysinibacillus sp. NPDC056959 TaxID=3345981 RepID=UPI0036312AB6